MTTGSAEPLVDETPLSPIDRQDSLEKHLQMRPDAQDLKNRNILHDTNAAPYAKMYGLSRSDGIDHIAERFRQPKQS